MDLKSAARPAPAAAGGVAACRLIELPRIADVRGNLTFVEGGRHLPFAIERVYYLYDVPGGAQRAGHAHRQVQQLMIAMSGSFDVHLDDGVNRRTVHLNRSYVGLYMCPMIWRELDNFSSGSVCMVLASRPYDESDYIRGSAEFLKPAAAGQMRRLTWRAGGSVRAAASDREPVPFLNLEAAVREVRAECDAAYARVMDSGRFLLGRELEAFEAEFAASCGVRDCVGVGNGLDALHLVLRALGVGPGDEVLVPAHTFIATWLAVSHVGARPVPVDAESDGYSLDPQRLEEASTRATKAIVPVHLYGEPAAMAAITAFGRRRGVGIVEDAAQAHGARLQGKAVGSWGAAAAFSFYPGKNLGAFADAGAVVSNDPVLAERVRRLRNYGGVRKYEHLEPGFNSRLGELQAAFLRVRLAHLEEWNGRRRAVAAAYQAGLSGLPGLRLPRITTGAEAAWHLYVVRHHHRDCLQDWLRAVGIETIVHYPRPPHRTPAYSALAGLRLPQAERLAQEVLSLPMGPHLGAAGVERVIAAVTEFCLSHATGETRACHQQVRAGVGHA